MTALALHPPPKVRNDPSLPARFQAERAIPAYWRETWPLFSTRALQKEFGRSSWGRKYFVWVPKACIVGVKAGYWCIKGNYIFRCFFVPLGACCDFWILHAGISVQEIDRIFGRYFTPIVCSDTRNETSAITIARVVIWHLYECQFLTNPRRSNEY